MGVTVKKQPTGLNYINNCSVWELNISGTIDETTDERGLYRLMSDDGAVTDWVALPPVGDMAVNFSKAIAGALSTPIPNFEFSFEASSMKKSFWLEYGDIVYDKENCSKTENLGNTTSGVEFVNGIINGGQSANFNIYTMRPDYMEVPRYGYFDFIYADAGAANFTIHLCNGSVITSSTSSAGDITAFGVGTMNSPVKNFKDDVVFYDVNISGTKYRFKVLDGESRGLNEWEGFSPLQSQNRITQVMFLEPSGGYSGVPCEYIESTTQEINFQEICVYDSGCYGEPSYSKNQGSSLFSKRAKARYNFLIRSPRTQQFGIWMQHFAASEKYLMLFRDREGAYYWANFIVDSIGEGYNKDSDYITFSGYLANGLFSQGS